MPKSTAIDEVAKNLIGGIVEVCVHRAQTAMKNIHIPEPMIQYCIDAIRRNENPKLGPPSDTLQ